MKTVQGLRHKGNFVVASPHAGFSNVTNNAAQSIFLIIPSPTTPASIEKCCSGGVGLHLSFLPAVFGLIRSFPRRALWISAFDVDRLGWVRPQLPGKGRAGSPNESTKCRDASLECVLSLASP